MDDFEAALISVADGDAFGASDFDPVAYLNKKFPHERSVQQNLDDVLESLQKEELEVENLLLESMREANMKCANTSLARNDIQADLDKLTQQLVDIEVRAKDTHSQVEILSRDIKGLDMAKHNLTMTVTRLKRFVMLVQALEQLRKHAQGREYKQVANLLLACDHLAGDFADLSEKVPKVAELFESKSRLLLQLRHQITEDYDTILGEEKIPRQLHSASSAVDAMDMREDILTRFCLKLLDEYKRVFQPPAEAAMLPGAEKRFTWLSHKLGEFAKEYKQYFAPEWNCDGVLCEHFCHVTKQHFVEVLGAGGSDPEVMIKVLRKTISFEHDLTQRYTSHGDTFKGIISDSFDLFLQPWVDSEEEELCGLWDGEDAIYHTTDHDTEGDSSASSEPKIVYSSAAELFVSIQGTLKRCVSFGKRQTLRAVFTAVERVLRKYCAALKDRLPSVSSSPSSSRTPAVSSTATPQIAGLTKDDAQTIGAVLGTCDYVSTKLPKLQELFEEVEWHEESMCFDECSDTYGELMSRCAYSFLDFGEISFKPLFRQWLGDTEEQPGAMSDGAQAITQLGNQLFEVVHHQLNALHFRFFLDKFAQWFVPEFIDSIYHHGVSEGAIQQLYLDTVSIKEAFVTMPGAFVSTVPLVYKDVITKKMEQAEVVFQVLLGEPTSSDVSSEQRQRIEALKDSREHKEDGKDAKAAQRPGKSKFFQQLDNFTKNTNQFAKQNKNWLTSLGKKT